MSMKVDNDGISNDLPDRVTALGSFAFTTHVDVVMVCVCAFLHFEHICPALPPYALFCSLINTGRYASPATAITRLGSGLRISIACFKLQLLR